MTKSIFLAIFIAITMSIFLFYIKYEVASLEDESQRLNKQILSQKQRIHVLRSEWSRLNDISRIKRLSEKHLKLRKTKPEQIKQENIVSKIELLVDPDSNKAGGK